MSEASSSISAPVAKAAAAATRSKRHWFYVSLSALMVILVFAGFWPSYYGPLLGGTVNVPAVLHIHGIVFMGWMALFVTQAVLGARGSLRTHRSLGRLGIAFGILIIVFGVYVSFIAPMRHVALGEWSIQEAAAFLPIPLIDMLLFGLLFGAAVKYRRKSDLHKRLMLLATVAILFAAAFRLNAAGMPMWLALGLWFLPVVLAMVFDLRRHGRIHPVYWVGLVLMVVSLIRLPFGNFEFWQSIGQPLFQSLTA